MVRPKVDKVFKRLSEGKGGKDVDSLGWAVTAALVFIAAYGAVLFALVVLFSAGIL